MQARYSGDVGVCETVCVVNFNHKEHKGLKERRQRMNSIQHGQARVIEVIETFMTRRGRGSNDDPSRLIRQYFSKDGELMAEVDPCAHEQHEENIQLSKDYNLHDEHKSLLAQRGRLADLIIWLANCHELTPEHRDEAMKRLMSEDRKGGTE